MDLSQISKNMSLMPEHSFIIRQVNVIGSGIFRFAETTHLTPLTGPGWQRDNPILFSDHGSKVKRSN